MKEGYFHRLTKQTPTRLWINNPTGCEMEQAIAAGAINSTTNPSYCARLIKEEPDYIRHVIDDVIQEIEDDNIAADLVYQRAASRLMNCFISLYKQSRGTCGYVTIQGDPGEDEDSDAIVNAALRHNALGKNYMAKIPVTMAGAQAIERLIPRDIPICATEVFSVSQAVYICELYKRIASQSGKHPLFYVTHITGIFDEYLTGIVGCNNINIAPEVLMSAGCVVAREEYRILKERGYETTMLGGGARGAQHFTELVSGNVHITINWSTAKQIIDTDGPVVSRINARVQEDILSELSNKLPDFQRAFYENALSPEEFKDFGPVRFFRDMFLKGYNNLLQEIAKRRVQQGATTRT
ncbi:MAG: hypothetical protein HY606_10625 [Planctomycetes bacterium]|nr:hypothetical protein [Planctomycetota bacterium]